MKTSAVRWTLMASLLFVPALLSAQTPSTPPTLPPSVTLPAELDRVLRDYERMWNSGDSVGMAKLWVDNQVVLTNSGLPAMNRSGVEARYPGPRSSGGGGGLSLRALSYAVDETVGWIIGAYATSPGRPDSGTFVLALRRAPGEKWLIAVDMDRSLRRQGQ